MQKRIRRSISLVLAAIMLTLLMPTKTLFADDMTNPLGTFVPCMADVSITLRDNSALPAMVAKNEDVSLRVDYLIPDDSFVAVNPYTFNIPVEATKRYTSEPIDIMDENNKSERVATVAIVPETGACTIIFTDYAQTSGCLDSGETGYFIINTSFYKEPSDNSVTKLTFNLSNGRSKEIPINFEADQIDGEMVVTKEVEADALNNRLKWTVTVTPELINTGSMAGDNKITNFTLSNLINTNPKLTVDVTTNTPTLVVTQSGGGTTPPTFTYSVNDNLLDYKITDYEWVSGDVLTLVYYTNYDMGIFSNADEVTFKNGVTASFACPQYDTSRGTDNLTISSTTIPVNHAKVEAEKKISAGYLSKDYAHNGAAQQITWTLTINKDKVMFTDNFVLADVIPNGLKLESVTLSSDGVAANSLTIESSESSLSTDTNCYYSSATSDYNGGTLKVKLSTGKAHVITYVTTIDPTIWQNENDHTFENTVSYTGKFDGNGYNFLRTKSAKIEFGGAGGVLIGASGSYDRSNHTFKWVIDVNRYGSTLNSGIVTIAIPEGHTYSKAAGVVCTDSAETSVVNDTDTKKLVVTLPSSISTKGTIKIETTVDDPAVWAHNSINKPYSINVALNAGSINLSSTPSANALSHVIDKASDPTIGYNYNTKEVTWKLTINQNKMAMTNPVITDVLQEGLEYVYTNNPADGITPSNVTIKEVTYDPSTRKLQIALEDIPKSLSEEHSLSFATRVSDNLLTHDGKEPSQEIKNTASIYFTELKSTPSPSASVARRVGSRPLQKSGDAATNPLPNYRSISWTIGINPNQINMTSPALTDTLPKGLVMDMDSVKLYKAKVGDNDGKMTKDTAPDSLVYDASSDLASNANYTSTLDGQNFTFKFNGNITSAYILKFDTDNMNALTTTYSNSVVFAGDAISLDSVSEVSQSSSNGKGSTNPNRGTIVITATDKDNASTKLAGVKYTVTGKKSRSAFTATTDRYGKAMFSPLKFDTYTVTEDISGIASSGYAAIKDTPTIELARSASGTPVTATSSLPYKTGGTAFTLKYDPNAPDATGVKPSDVNRVQDGTTSIGDNPFDRPKYVFTGWNTAANGSGDPYSPGDSFTFTANTTLYAQWEKSEGKIILKAQTVDGTKVFGNLSLTIAPAGGGLPIQKTTNSAGEAIFDVKLGSYKLVTPPSEPKDYKFIQADKLSYSISKDIDTDKGILLYSPGNSSLTNVSIAYNGNGSTSGSEPDMQTYPFSTQVTVLNNPFAKNGFRFVGWNTSKDGSGVGFQPGDVFNIEYDTTLYAVWTPMNSGRNTSPSGNKNTLDAGNGVKDKSFDIAP